MTKPFLHCYSRLLTLVLGLCFASSVALADGSTGCCFSYTTFNETMGKQIVNISATPNYALSPKFTMESFITFNPAMTPSNVQAWPNPESNIVNCTYRTVGDKSQFYCTARAPVLAVAFEYTTDSSVLSITTGDTSSGAIYSVELYTDVCNYSPVGCVVIPLAGQYDANSELSLGALGHVPLWAVATAGVAIGVLTIGCTIYGAKLYLAKRKMRQDAAHKKITGDKQASVTSAPEVQISLPSPKSPSKSLRNVSRLSLMSKMTSESSEGSDDDDDIVYNEHPVEGQKSEEDQKASGRFNMSGGHFRDMSNVSVVYQTRPLSNAGQATMQASRKKNTKKAKPGKKWPRLVPFANNSEEDDQSQSPLGSPVKNMIIEIPSIQEEDEETPRNRKSKLSPIKSANGQTVLKSPSQYSTRNRSLLKSPATPNRQLAKEVLESPKPASVAFTDYSISSESPNQDMASYKRRSSLRSVASNLSKKN